MRVYLDPMDIDYMEYVANDMVLAFHGPDLFAKFIKAMRGQTAVEMHGVCLYYYRDYLRWAKGMPVVD